MSVEGPERIVRITWSTAVLAVSVVLGFIFVRGAFVAAHRVLAWTAAAIAVAVFVEPIVDKLDRWMPRGIAVALTFLAIAGVAGGLVFGAVADLDNEVQRLKQVMPDAIEQLEERNDEIGSVAREIDLSRRSESFLDALDERVGSGSGALAQNAPTLPVYFVSAILTIFLLVYGPKIAQGAVEQVAEGRRRQVFTNVLSNATHRARRTVSALLTQGATVGLVVFGTAKLVVLPAPIVLGLIAGVMAMLPDVGILMGVLPTVALIAALESVGLAVVVLSVALVVQLVEAFYLRRQVKEFGVDVGPAVIWIVALVGFTVYGPGMAFYGIAYAIFILAVIDQVPAVRAELDRELILPTGHSAG